MAYKDVTEAAIVMALRRLAEKARKAILRSRKDWRNYEMIVRSRLGEWTVMNEALTAETYRRLVRLGEVPRKYFFTVTEGIFETTIIASLELKKRLLEILTDVRIVSSFEGLSSITIRLTEQTVATPGVYYLILMQLAWEGINVIEIVSTFREFTVVLSEKQVDRAFTALKSALA